MNNQIRSIIETVQSNCHISDARHASDYTLCIYLLKMREFYRWEKSISYNEELDSNHIGHWLAERESLWEQVQTNQYQALSFNQDSHQIFDADSINQQLLKQGLIYSAGYGPKSKPVFYLAQLEQQIIRDDFTIYISGQELARDLTAPVAMSQQNNIFIRRESIQHMIWEKTVEWGWHKNKNAMFKAMQFYDFADEPEQSLIDMTSRELNNIILHEIGEIQTAKALNNWQQMILDLPGSQAEIMARAIKDLLSDLTSTLPTLIKDQNDASLHFYFANFTHMRKELAPDLIAAYQAWDKNGNYQQLLRNTNRAAEFWFDLARDILDLYQHHGVECSTHIETLVKENKLGASA